ncbi:MAG: MoxR family ATPase [Oscillospiraceae bacterium]|nr:MoxR family ATPase [Oscillospiraceae bacterium]
MEIAEIAALAARIRENVEKVIISSGDHLELMLTALIAGGHVLLDDVPGTGKTVTAKALAKSLGVDMKRIQFTPDLLPGDVTGMSVFNQKENVFEFREGPAFTNVLLADEINRATPRTQSALLECMEEKQITADGVTRSLGRPFFVIATQNPVETGGTFPLPEAQLDRFLMRLRPGYPGAEGEKSILDRFINNDPLAELESVASGSELIDAQASCSAVQVSDPVRYYIVALTEATRTPAEVSLGVSPRGMLWMLKAAQAWAAVHGRDYVLPDDVKKLAAPVFAHRLVTRSGYGAAERSEELIRELTRAVPVPSEDPAAEKLLES